MKKHASNSDDEITAPLIKEIILKELDAMLWEGNVIYMKYIWLHHNFQCFIESRKYL